MNPFTGTLNRKGYLLWNLFVALWIGGFGVLIDLTKAHHIGAYWLPLRVIWAAVFIFFDVLVIYRRIQNAGLNRWLVLLWLVPFIGSLFWFVLFFVPPKNNDHISTT